MTPPEAGPELPDGSRDPAKARLAARDPARPGEACRAPAGRWVPRVDRRRCEGKQDCVAVCPYDVFELGTLSDDEFAALGLLGRIRARAHELRTARTPNASECRACGLCVVACPEDALVLVRVPPDPA